MVFGEPVWTTTHGGYTLALANNPVYYDDVLNGPPGRVWTGHDQWLWWDSVNRATAGMTEPQADRYHEATVWRLVRERPGDFARAVLSRLGHFWSVAPAASVYSGGVRWATMAWTLPLWVAVLLGLPRRDLWRWPRIAAPLSAIGLTLVHGFFWTDMRMRADRAGDRADRRRSGLAEAHRQAGLRGHRAGDESGHAGRLSWRINDRAFARFRISLRSRE